jgi:hypothetical protein
VRHVLEPLPGLDEPDLPVDSPAFRFRFKAVEEGQRAGEKVPVGFRVAVKESDERRLECCRNMSKSRNLSSSISLKNKGS